MFSKYFSFVDCIHSGIKIIVANVNLNVGIDTKVMVILLKKSGHMGALELH